jgi:hypothetical protein
MNELDINDFTDEELLQYAIESDEEYQEWNVNLENLINSLSDDNKIFLSDLGERIGEKAFYIIYGYLNSENLIDYDDMTEGRMSEFVSQESVKQTV